MTDKMTLELATEIAARHNWKNFTWNNEEYENKEYKENIHVQADEVEGGDERRTEDSAFGSKDS